MVAITEVEYIDILQNSTCVDKHRVAYVDYRDCPISVRVETLGSGQFSFDVSARVVNE